MQQVSLESRSTDRRSGPTTGVRLTGGWRHARKLNPDAARLSYHEVEFRTLARPFWRKLDLIARPCRDTRVQCVKCVVIHNLQCKVMQAEITVAFERHARLRILDLPKRYDGTSVRYKGRWIAWILTNNPPTKAIAKELPRQCKVLYGKAYVIHTDR
jgi:hypothetical protein